MNFRIGIYFLNINQSEFYICDLKTKKHEDTVKILPAAFSLAGHEVVWA
jgi:hypothetical protein